MLRKETVEEPTLELLKKLMQDDLLKDFFLVGGTALSSDWPQDQYRP